jgi:hypothetical protein
VSRLAAIAALALGVPSVARAQSSPAPFGPGASVQVTSSAPADVYVAPLAALESPDPTEYDFKALGAAPLSFQLPKGPYLLEVEGDGVTRGSLRLDMGPTPRSVRIEPGSAALGDAAALLMAVGIVGVVAGVALLAAGTKADGGFDKPAILIPMFAIGGVSLGAGIGCYFGSRTSVEDVSSAKR